MWKNSSNQTNMNDSDDECQWWQHLHRWIHRLIQLPNTAVITVTNCLIVDCLDCDLINTISILEHHFANHNGNHRKCSHRIVLWRAKYEVNENWEKGRINANDWRYIGQHRISHSWFETKLYIVYSEALICGSFQSFKKWFTQGMDSKRSSNYLCAILPCGICIIATVHPLMMSAIRSFFTLYCESHVQIGNMLRNMFDTLKLHIHCAQFFNWFSSKLQ